ncbi:MAG TPA: hypothetical protein ENI34_10655, partial [candidate division WOR-3 bacterium]|nr:hypothetical protein [candidate division WOR-3 bacterium]
MNKRPLFLSVFFMIVLTAVAYSQHGFSIGTPSERSVPQLLNYQGYLTDTLQIPLDDTLDMVFKIYDASSGGNELWNETQTGVIIERGVFSVLLGSVNAIPDSVFTVDTARWLELTVGGEVLSPRTRITSVGYAYTATYSDTAEYARNATADNDWTRGSAPLDSVLFTADYLGIARGGAGNMLFGNDVYTHTNLGIACTTGTSGEDLVYCTVTGGYGNIAAWNGATISGGSSNTADSAYAVIGGGESNTASHWYATISGGWNNSAEDACATIGGGQDNTVINRYATIGGGESNEVSGNYGVVSGGDNNNCSAYYGTIGGGSQNYVGGSYSAILGGYADTITTGAGYSYLFGIAGKLTQDSTFMVDMPHIRFGDESTGYEFPAADGAADQVMVTDGSGQLSWTSGSSWSKWTVSDSVLYTKNRWGVARGGAGNVLYGTNTYTHTNLGGFQCATGVDGENYSYITVCGGYNNRGDSSYSTVVGGYQNRAYGASSFVGGGSGNTGGGYQSFIGGGASNTTSHSHTVVAGGLSNDAGGDYSVISGGRDNTAGAYAAVVAGGRNNSADYNYAVISGGYNNTAGSPYAVIGGGNANFIESAYSAILGGYADTIAAGASYSYLFGITSKLTQDSTFMVDMPHIRFGDESTGYEFPAADGFANQAMVTDGSGQLSWADIEDNDWIRGSPDSVLFTTKALGVARGGVGNILYGDYVYRHLNFGGYACTTGTDGSNWTYLVICGGYGNLADSSYAAVVNGIRNKARGQYSFIGSGHYNYTTGQASAVCGGRSNEADGFRSFIGGGYSNEAGDSPSDTAAVVSGGWDNSATARYSFVGGGKNNNARGLYSVVSGGGGSTAADSNSARGDYSVVAGGSGNIATNSYSTVSGGGDNTAGGSYSTVNGGWSNSTAGTSSIVGGGYMNKANGYTSVVAGGRVNTANNYYTAICGGYADTVNGHYSGALSGYSNLAGD